MSDIVTGTPAVVGFTNGQHGYNNFQHGWTDKDQGFASVVDAGERTRDILAAIATGLVTTEKTGAASVLASEKVGAANIVETVRSTQLLQVQAQSLRAETAAQAERYQIANTLALSDMRLEQQKQACDIQRDIAECCCKLEARILEVESNRVRDDLSQARAELIALKSCCGSNPGNGNNLR
jgi:hypothetical protein